MRRLAHISDLHFGRHDEVVVEALLASLAEHRPDLVIASGDFTQRARNHEFLAARAFLDRVAAPKIVIPGNHDIPLYRIVQRLFRPMRRYDLHIGPAGLAQASYVDGEVAVVGLNSARRLTGKNGRVSSEQIEQLQRVFAAAPPTALRVLVTHHPLASPGGALPIELALRADRAVPAAIAAGAQLLLSGHHHRAVSGGQEPDAEIIGPLVVVHAGTATSNRRRGEPNSYNLLTVAADLVDVSVLEWSSAGFENAKRQSYWWREGGWRRAATPAPGTGT